MLFGNSGRPALGQRLPALGTSSRQLGGLETKAIVTEEKVDI